MGKAFKLPKSLSDPKFRVNRYTYWYGNKKLRSMSQWLRQFQKPFDSDYWSKRKAEERGVEPQVILDEWAAKGDASKALGIQVHAAIEAHLNGNPVPDLEDEPYKRYIMFRNLMETRLKGAQAVAQELVVFSPDLGIAGAMDSLMLIPPDSLLYVGDWKTNEKFSSGDEGFGNLLGPFEDLKDNNLNIYSLQVSLLRVLGEEHGLKIHGGFITHLAPEAPEAVVHFARDYRDRVRDVLKATAPKAEPTPF